MPRDVKFPLSIARTSVNCVTVKCCVQHTFPANAILCKLSAAGSRRWLPGGITESFYGRRRWKLSGTPLLRLTFVFSLLFLPSNHQQHCLPSSLDFPFQYTKLLTALVIVSDGSLGMPLLTVISSVSLVTKGICYPPQNSYPTSAIERSQRGPCPDDPSSVLPVFRVLL